MTRVTVDLSPEDYATLCSVSDRLGESKAAVLRRAIGVVNTVVDLAALGELFVSRGGHRLGALTAAEEKRLCPARESR